MRINEMVDILDETKQIEKRLDAKQQSLVNLIFLSKNLLKSRELTRVNLFFAFFIFFVIFVKNELKMRNFLRKDRQKIII
jgi:hypothetical protein